MRSFAKVFCLSLLSVALLAGSAQARTVKGCVIKAKTSCAGKNLSGQNLRGVNLSKADLRGANLSHANLRGANLTGAKLGPKPTAKKKGARTSATPACAPNCYGASLYYADLSNANLYDADLSYANMNNTNLYDANLAFANLSSAILAYANLSEAYMTYVILNATYFYSTTCQNGMLTLPSTNAAGVLSACPAY